MTPDELFTRVHRQRADLAAAELALDALMEVLPPELQQSWLQALRSLQATRTEYLTKQKADPDSLRQSNEAIDRRVARLRVAAKD